jgi:GDPmannose 4,6-dehydratase
MKIAVIIGVNGQDGRFLYNFLKNDNYSVIGFDINYVISTKNEWEEILSITSFNEVEQFIKTVKPDELYYLAAYHHSSEDVIANEIELVNKSYEINVFSYVNFLEAIRLYSKKTRIFYAASCHIFGDPDNPKQNEYTENKPQSIYSITKYSGLKLSEYYRNNFSVFASVGILYNHESHLRSEKFVSRKIVKTAVEIKNNKKDELIIGKMDMEIDWGYAGDFVIAFVQILNYHTPENFIIATGRTHKLKDFIKYVFDYLDLDWRKYVKQDATLLTRTTNGIYCGDYNKLLEVIGWNPTMDLKSLAHLMVDKELQNKG